MSKGFIDSFNKCLLRGCFGTWDTVVSKRKTKAHRTSKLSGHKTHVCPRCGVEILNIKCDV